MLLVGASVVGAAGASTCARAISSLTIKVLSVGSWLLDACCGRWIHQGIEDYLIGGDARQIQVLAAPIHQLACAHVIVVTPEEGVELVADGTGTQLVGQ